MNLKGHIRCCQSDEKDKKKNKSVDVQQVYLDELMWWILPLKLEKCFKLCMSVKSNSAMSIQTNLKAYP